MNFKINNLSTIKKKIVIIKKKYNKKINRIINYIKKYKDDGLVKLTKKFEGRILKKKQIKVNLNNLNYSKLSKKKKIYLNNCRNNIIKFHKLQKKYIMKNWFVKNKNFKFVGQRISPINKVGIYSPGGSLYPSSILMNIIPAIISGVKNIFLCTPIKLKKKNLSVFYAAKICGLKNIYNVGGAQAIAAMAFGTKRIKKVNKIFGPGNIFVNNSKKAVFGNVGLANLAGPTEITIIFDKKNDKKRIIYEVFSQIEHDNDCVSIFICNNKFFLIKIINKIKKIIGKYKKSKIFRSIKNSFFFYEKKKKNICKIANYFATEHISLLVSKPSSYLKYIKSSGTVFLGKKTFEPMGDYSIGINHVLPTEKSSKFSSPLGVYDFYKIMNLVYLKNNKDYINLAKKMAKMEKFYFHKKVMYYD
ncbi:histidinol dehydrogenase [Candidatus Vidania fulgoroideorum]